jgi:hypothetical protein
VSSPTDEPRSGSEYVFKFKFPPSRTRFRWRLAKTSGDNAINPRGPRALPAAAKRDAERSGLLLQRHELDEQVKPLGVALPLDRDTWKPKLVLAFGPSDPL